MYEDPKVWTFFEKEGTQWLDDNIAIRVAESSAHQCKFFFMGKRNLFGPSPPRHTVVKFSTYEGRRLLKFLNNILVEIHDVKGLFSKDASSLKTRTCNLSVLLLIRH